MTVTPVANAPKALRKSAWETVVRRLDILRSSSPDSGGAVACPAAFNYQVMRNANCTCRGLKIERGVPYDELGEPSRFPDGVAVQPTACGSAAKGQKSAAPYAVL